VRVRAGIAARTLLTKEELNVSGPGGGLIVVGSHVSRTTTQLDALLAKSSILPVEVNVESLLDPVLHHTEIERAADLVNIGIKSGRDVAVYTSRELVVGENAQTNLQIGQETSAGLIDILRKLEPRPRYLLAKGGITASDIATKALSIKKAMVLGQIQPGVPIWQLGPESRYPGMPYIVFPGNVGDTRSLIQITETLKS
jgi:uncharacterized protein YgbK (DUF1537 family)